MLRKFAFHANAMVHRMYCSSNFLAQEHDLIGNCLNCGKIVCVLEGPGPCMFCGNLVLAKIQSNGDQANDVIQKNVVLNQKKKAKVIDGTIRSYSGKVGGSATPSAVPSGDEDIEKERYQKAVDRKERLLTYQRDGEARTRVIGNIVFTIYVSSFVCSRFSV